MNYKEDIVELLESKDENLNSIIQEITYRRKAYETLKHHTKKEEMKENYDVLIEEFDKLIEFIHYRLINNLSSKS